MIGIYCSSSTSFHDQDYIDQIFLNNCIQNFCRARHKVSTLWIARERKVGEDYIEQGNRGVNGKVRENLRFKHVIFNFLGECKIEHGVFMFKFTEQNSSGSPDLGSLLVMAYRAVRLKFT
ncbi:hypothetical protein HHI36_007190 [Cryptolaemus montrouzieri]|uniref:Uncharacterized protein n=1 Tax=Cryptolaemus montrouzieri TaxID=559131 RepID=A0ABD2MPN2_9CUCU